MKKLLYGILALTIAASSTACLDENPEYSQNSKVIFSSETYAEMALLGCYYKISNSGSGYGDKWQTGVIAASGLMMAHTANDAAVLMSLSIAPSNIWIELMWYGMYDVVVEVNTFIDSMNDSSLPAETKARMINEARFLRAIAYYNIVAHFGDAPLVLDVPSFDSTSLPRTPVKDIFDAAIIPDLQAALTLPETSDYGRLNGNAAEAFLGKAYYKMAMLGIDREANLNNAKTHFENVLDAYELDADPATAIFGAYNASASKEVIIQLTMDNNSAQSDACFNRASNWISPPTSTKDGIHNAGIRVAKYAYDFHYGTYMGDPRVELNFMTHWDRYNVAEAAAPYMCGYPYRLMTPANKATCFEVCLPYELFADPTNPTKEELQTFVATEGSADGHATATQITNQTKLLWDYFTTPGAQGIMIWPFVTKVFDPLQSSQMSRKPVIVYRYSEMLLLLADVYNELEGPAKAIPVVNRVLARARNMGSTTGQPADWSTSLTKDEVTEKLYYERIFELFGEPSIYDMTRIRGTELLGKLLIRNNRHHMTRDCYENYLNNAQNFADRLFDQGQEDQLSETFLKKNLLLPIPTKEIDTNPGISPEDQNFGY